MPKCVVLDQDSINEPANHEHRVDGRLGSRAKYGANDARERLAVLIRCSDAVGSFNICERWSGWTVLLTAGASSARLVECTVGLRGNTYQIM
jgi:hypothetical protein